MSKKKYSLEDLIKKAKEIQKQIDELENGDTQKSILKKKYKKIMTMIEELKNKMGNDINQEKEKIKKQTEIGNKAKEHFINFANEYINKNSFEKELEEINDNLEKIDIVKKNLVNVDYGKKIREYNGGKHDFTGYVFKEYVPNEKYEKLKIYPFEDIGFFLNDIEKRNNTDKFKKQFTSVKLDLYENNPIFNDKKYEEDELNKRPVREEYEFSDIDDNYRKMNHIYHDKFFTENTKKGIDLILNMYPNSTINVYEPIDHIINERYRRQVIPNSYRIEGSRFDFQQPTSPENKIIRRVEKDDIEYSKRIIKYLNDYSKDKNFPPLINLINNAYYNDYGKVYTKKADFQKNEEDFIPYIIMDRLIKSTKKDFNERKRGSRIISNYQLTDKMEQDDARIIWDLLFENGASFPNSNESHRVYYQLFNSRLGGYNFKKNPKLVFRPRMVGKYIDSLTKISMPQLFTLEELDKLYKHNLRYDNIFKQYQWLFPNNNQFPLFMNDTNRIIPFRMTSDINNNDTRLLNTLFHEYEPEFISTVNNNIDEIMKQTKDISRITKFQDKTLNEILRDVDNIKPEVYNNIMQFLPVQTRSILQDEESNSNNKFNYYRDNLLDVIVKIRGMINTINNKQKKANDNIIKNSLQNLKNKFRNMKANEEEIDKLIEENKDQFTEEEYNNLKNYKNDISKLEDLLKEIQNNNVKELFDRVGEKKVLKKIFKLYDKMSKGDDFERYMRSEAVEDFMGTEFYDSLRNTFEEEFGSDYVKIMEKMYDLNNATNKTNEEILKNLKTSNEELNEKINIAYINNEQLKKENEEKINKIDNLQKENDNMVNMLKSLEEAVANAEKEKNDAIFNNTKISEKFNAYSESQRQERQDINNKLEKANEENRKLLEENRRLHEKAKILSEKIDEEMNRRQNDKMSKEREFMWREMEDDTEKKDPKKNANYYYEKYEEDLNKGNVSEEFISLLNLLSFRRIKDILDVKTKKENIKPEDLDYLNNIIDKLKEHDIFTNEDTERKRKEEEETKAYMENLKKEQEAEWKKWEEKRNEQNERIKSLIATSNFYKNEYNTANNNLIRINENFNRINSEHNNMLIEMGNLIDDFSRIRRRQRESINENNQDSLMNTTFLIEDGNPNILLSDETLVPLSDNTSSNTNIVSNGPSPPVFSNGESTDRMRFRLNQMRRIISEYEIDNDRLINQLNELRNRLDVTEVGNNSRDELERQINEANEENRQISENYRNVINSLEERLNQTEQELLNERQGRTEDIKSLQERHNQREEELQSEIDRINTEIAEQRNEWDSIYSDLNNHINDLKSKTSDKKPSLLINIEEALDILGDHSPNQSQAELESAVRGIRLIDPESEIITEKINSSIHDLRNNLTDIGIDPDSLEGKIIPQSSVEKAKDKIEKGISIEDVENLLGEEVIEKLRKTDERIKDNIQTNRINTTIDNLNNNTEAPTDLNRRIRKRAIEIIDDMENTITNYNKKVDNTYLNFLNTAKNDIFKNIKNDKKLTEEEKTKMFSDLDRDMNNISGNYSKTKKKALLKHYKELLSLNESLIRHQTAMSDSEKIKDVFNNIITPKKEANKDEEEYFNSRFKQAELKRAFGLEPEDPDISFNDVKDYLPKQFYVDMNDVLESKNFKQNKPIVWLKDTNYNSINNTGFSEGMKKKLLKIYFYFKDPNYRTAKKNEYPREFLNDLQMLSKYSEKDVYQIYLRYLRTGFI